MTSHGQPERSGRETRLLALVVIVAILVLLALARFRFPEADLATVAPTTSPLERLAARAPLEDLGITVTSVLQNVAPWIVMVRLDPPAPPAALQETPQTLDPPPMSPAPEPATEIVVLPGAAIPPTGPSRWAVALRLRRGLGVLAWPSGVVAGALLGSTAAPEVTPADPATGLAFVRLPLLPAFVGLPSIDTYPGFGYVAVVEAGRGGLSVRPVFVGRLDPVEVPELSSFVMVLAGSHGIAPGSLLFSLSGQFIGLSVDTVDGVAIVQSRALAAAADGVDDVASEEQSAAGERDRRSAAIADRVAPGP